jgi:signal transduction histidine kinase
LFTHEGERARISRELHDSLGQQISSLALQAASVTSQSSATAVDAALAELCRMSKRAAHEVRGLATTLRPPLLDDLGLVDAIKEYASDLGRIHVLDARVEEVGTADPVRLCASVETSLYRIVQEALGNAARHARARVVSVLVHHRSGELRLVVEDDGVGFVPGDVRSGLGLVGMEERAKLFGGVLSIESSPGVGTAVYVSVPRARQ